MYSLLGTTFGGDGIPAAAHAWFERVALSSPEAQFQLGRMHRDGIGAEVSPGEARHWFERAASQGYVSAYYPTAKGCMWLCATQERTRDAMEREQPSDGWNRCAIMPDTGLPDQDARVATHLRDTPALN